MTTAAPMQIPSSDMASHILSELRILCPRCRAIITEQNRSRDNQAEQMLCTSCLFQIMGRDGIWDALPPERADHYATFISDYEKIRAAEGRGSRNPEFYLALPELDLSGRNQSQWTIRARTYQCLVSSLLEPLERGGSTPLKVLDLGAGNCWLSFQLALRGHRPVAVDLLLNPFDGLGAAQHYQRRVPTLFPRFRAELDRLPFADGQFDIAIFNASFHYSENYARTLAEALRCVRRPGTVVIADTPWYSRRESGEAMLQERQTFFEAMYGFASDALPSLEFLTDERLEALQDALGLRWNTLDPDYGLQWRLRPLIAKIRGRREPSRFRIYVAEVTQ
jgi:SAM-dependent methyltransferase